MSVCGVWCVCVFGKEESGLGRALSVDRQTY